MAARTKSRKATKRKKGVVTSINLTKENFMSLVEEGQVRPEDVTLLGEFMKTGVARYTVGRDPLVLFNDILFRIQGGIGRDCRIAFEDFKNECDVGRWPCDEEERAKYKEAYLPNGDPEDYFEVECPDRPAVFVLAPGNILLANGDDEDEGMEPDDCPCCNVTGCDGVKTLSFACLRQMFNDEKDLETALAKGTIKIVEITSDEERNVNQTIRTAFTAANRKRNRNRTEAPIITCRKKFKPPQRGFMLIGDSTKSLKWHRPGFAVLQRGKNFFVLGMDEDSYFCSQLPDGPKPTNVGEALDALMPEEVRNLNDVDRQGEWYVIPVEAKVIGCVTRAQYFQNSGSLMNISRKDSSVTENPVFTLPLETPDSNPHTVKCDEWRMIDGVMYAENPRLYHEEHSELEVHGWCHFVKNTAVRSVSVGGVD